MYVTDYILISGIDFIQVYGGSKFCDEIKSAVMFGHIFEVWPNYLQSCCLPVHSD